MTRAYGSIVSSLVALIAELNDQIKRLEQELTEAFEDHLDAEILTSLPGLGVVLGARGAGGVRRRPNPLRRC